MNTKNVFFISGMLFLASMSACTKSSDTPAASGGYTADAPSGLMTAVASRIAAAGSGMVSGTALTSLGKGDFSTAVTSANCTTHGDPAETDGTTQISDSDVRYPAYLTYCKMTKDDGSPDTIQGNFSLIKAISCALEAGGITFDGTTRTRSITPSSACFSAGQLTDIGTSPIELDVTGSKPASFNSYFDAGIVIENPDIGTFQIGSKVSGTKIEFATFDDAGTGNKFTVTGASLDTSTGILQAESRIQRIDCATSGSCGWNRHWRVYADMNGDALEEISFAYSNIAATPGQSSFGGVLVTASGTGTDGVKGRAWQATNGAAGAPTTLSHYYTAGNWTEVANTVCLKGGSDAGTTCGSGIAKFSTNANFVLNSSFSSAGTTPASWFTNFDGLVFTSVDPDSEAQ